jgi:hypothetical protein
MEKSYQCCSDFGESLNCAEEFYRYNYPLQNGMPWKTDIVALTT